VNKRCRECSGLCVVEHVTARPYFFKNISLWTNTSSAESRPRLSFDGGPSITNPAVREKKSHAFLVILKKYFRDEFVRRNGFSAR
jgi:hypothetical protein